MIEIVLAEDHQLVRHGLRALLEAEPDLSVVGEAENGQEAVELMERLRPHVLLLDVVMPVMNGLDAARQVSQRWPATRILLLSMHSADAYVLEALRNGASGYVLKGASAGTLVEAVRTVAGGRRYLCPPLTERAIDAYVQQGSSATLDAYETLTAREREVLQLAAEGRPNTEIAARLSISPRTVEIHRGNLMHKLSLRGQTELVRFALRRGIISLDS